MSVQVGVPTAKLAALATWETSPAFSARERAALQFATAVVRDDRTVTDAEWTQLRAHFSEPEAVELVFAIGYQTFASQFAKAFQLAPQGFAGYGGVDRRRGRATPPEAVERGRHGPVDGTVE